MTRTRLFRFAWIGVLTLSAVPCTGALPADAELSLPALPAVLLPADDRTVTETIRWLENKVQADPDDFVAHNKLADRYLQRLRETGNATYLMRASNAARASLAALPPSQNRDGLNLLAQVEFSAHEFSAAREHARLLVGLEPDKAYPYQILGDTLLELGDYEAAEAAFRQMQRLGAVQGITRVATEQRVGKLAALRGDTATAQRSFVRALELALALPVPSRETVAWCRWQLGETAFSVGDYVAAEQHYRDALTTFPDYFRALASLGRVRAARGDLAGAIAQYERVVTILPDPAFVAALGDLYLLAGRDRDAARQFEVVEAIARLGAAGGSLYNRQQAMFHADHDRQPQDAYAMAVREYAVRRDIYGADAVAWTALKAGRIAEARTAIQDALRLNTRDARLDYHAAMIARAASDDAAARFFFERALAQNPQFDPLQASVARKIAASSVTDAGAPVSTNPDATAHTHDAQPR